MTEQNEIRKPRLEILTMPGSESYDLLDSGNGRKLERYGDHVLIREGMLTLATQEIAEPHEDVVESTEDLGEIMLIMRLGGRHMQWGADPNIMATYQE